MYEIKQKKKSYNVKIDDSLSVVFTPLMAGTDLLLSQKQRKAQFLEKKIAALQDTAKTEQDFDNVEKSVDELNKIEADVDEIIRYMFKPIEGSEKGLNEWLKSMSLSELIVAVQEIGEQVNGKPATA